MNYDWVIVGGGIVGLTIARHLRTRFPKDSIAIFEKETSLGAHASGRNSGVLHAGIYYTPGTLKARLSVEGAQLLRDYCLERSLPFMACGKILVPMEASHQRQISTLVKNALSNGVSVQVLDRVELLKREARLAPHIEEGLYSPDTSVFAPLSVMKSLADELIQKSLALYMGEPVLQFHMKTRSLKTPHSTYSYGHLINAAGAYAVDIAHAYGVARQYSILPFKGSYYKLKPESAEKIRHHIYPFPDLRLPFLGVHFTKSLDGTVYVGPNAFPAFGLENYRSLKGVDWNRLPSFFSKLAWQYFKNENGLRQHIHNEVYRFSKSNFLKEAKKLVHDLQADDLLPTSKVGIRPQLYNKSDRSLVMDFLIEKGPHSTHVLNAVSPAFTCSLSFAKFLVEQLGTCEVTRSQGGSQ